MAETKEGVNDTIQETRDILKSKILIVDDEECVRSFLIDTLELYPYFTKSAVDAYEAIELLKQEQFDLLLSDINLPGMSGLDLFSYCRKHHKDMPVILITGNPELDDAIGAIKKGVFDYIAKPIVPENLYTCVAKALKNFKQVFDAFSVVKQKFSNSEYDIIKILGSGNCGTVFLVEKGGVEYAMKVLERMPGDLLQDTKIERFIREAEILSDIDHQNIVKMFDYGILDDDDETPYIVMEYLSGKPLNQVISEMQLSLSEKIRIIKDIADILSVVHKKGILHRDIKPANIMLTDDNVIKLMDFGIARLRNSNLTMTQELLGSPAYMPPETFESVQLSDVRSEIYSLGVIAYELFTGVRPFVGNSIVELINTIKTVPPLEPKKLCADFPDYIQEIIGVMLSKKKDDRFSSMEDVIDAFENKRVSIKHSWWHNLIAGKTKWR